MGGWAAVIRGEKNYEIADSFECKTSYEAELCAVYKALETSEGKISIVCDHQGIVNHMHHMLDKGMDWTPPDNNKSLWLKIMYEAKDKLESVTWKKCDSTPEMRIAHKMANTHANCASR
jgi:ribonuclease HI